MENTENKTDVNFENICKISSKIFEIAKKKLAGEKVKIDVSVDEVKDKLQNLLDGVSFINEIEAKRLVSETILDLGYITNLEVKVLSLRLGQLYRNQQRVNEE